MICGPIERLRLGGILCACIESQDQFYYRLADLALRSVKVRWLRRLGQYSLSSTIATKKGSATTDSKTSSVVKPPNAIMNAQLDVVDTAKGPAVRLTSSQFVFADEDDGDVVAISESIVLSKTVLLREIFSVTGGTFDEWARMGLLAGDGRIMNAGVLIKSKSGSGNHAKERTLIFEVKAQHSVKHGLSRNDVVKHINTLVDFERSRLGLAALERTVEGSGGDDVDVSTESTDTKRGGPNSITESREDCAIIPLNRTMSLNEEF